MSSRRPSVTLTPIGGARPTKNPLVSPEYMEAVQQLNESVMNDACEWVLDSADLDADKLLDVYHKCEAAWKVIQKHQTTMFPGSATLPPAPPSLSPLSVKSTTSITGQIRGGALPKLTSLSGSNNSNNTNNKNTAISKTGVVPMRRTKVKTGRMRADSDSDVSQMSGTSASTVNHKKPRLTNPTNTDNPRAPPPAALNFLAKLNKDGNKLATNGGNDAGADLPQNSNSPTAPPAPTTTHSASPPGSLQSSPLPPKRNPARAAHNRRAPP